MHKKTEYEDPVFNLNELVSVVNHHHQDYKLSNLLQL